MPDPKREPSADFSKVEGLEDNWDSYGAGPLSAELIQAAKNLLEQLITQGMRGPDRILPTAGPSILLEWHQPVYFDLEITGVDTVEWFVEKAGRNG